MANLTIATQATAYEDADTTSNPSQLPVDWKFQVTNLPVDNPSTTPFTVPAGGTFLVVDGSRPTSLDGSTVFNLRASPVVPSRYRVTNTAGAAPVFRTDRAVSVQGVSLALAANRNQAVTVVAGSSAPFTSVQVGDVVLVPGPSTGDPVTLFSQLNEGYWSVLTATGTTLTLARLPGQPFSGVTETVVPASNGQFRVFSAAGVQVGDSVDISAGFSAPARRTFVVVALAPDWFEFQSTSPLGEESGIAPGVTGMLFYAAAKRWIRIEVDQECVVRLNGDTGTTNRVVPIIAGDRRLRGWFEKFGPVWRAEVVNRASVPARMVFLAAE